MKKPLLHALSAGAYIVLIVNLINFFGHSNAPEDTILAPIAMLSLLVLSVAFMTFIFFYDPVRMFGAGDTKGALDFFGKTLACFAGLVVLLGIIFIVINF